MAHIHEKIDFTVEVFVVHRGKVLIRKHEKYGVWLSVGGHIELDEDPNQAALREVKEEVGLDVTLLDTRRYKGDERVIELIPPISLNRHRISDTHEHVSFVYFAVAGTDAVVPEKETDEWRWCTEHDLETLELQGSVHFFAKEAIKQSGTLEVYG